MALGGNRPSGHDRTLSRNCVELSPRRCYDPFWSDISVFVPLPPLDWFFVEIVEKRKTAINWFRTHENWHLHYGTEWKFDDCLIFGDPRASKHRQHMCFWQFLNFSFLFAKKCSWDMWFLRYVIRMDRRVAGQVARRVQFQRSMVFWSNVFWNFLD